MSSHWHAPAYSNHHVVTIVRFQAARADPGLRDHRGPRQGRGHGRHFHGHAEPPGPCGPSSGWARQAAGIGAFDPGCLRVRPSPAGPAQRSLVTSDLDCCSGRVRSGRILNSESLPSRSLSFYQCLHVELFRVAEVNNGCFRAMLCWQIRVASLGVSVRSESLRLQAQTRWTLQAQTRWTLL